MGRIRDIYVQTYCASLIGGAQQSIGLVPRKIAPDRNGMVSGRDLMMQPFRFGIYFARDYDFNQQRTQGLHVVVARNDFRYIHYSSDPREGTESRKFSSCIELARHCAMAQIAAAASLSMSRDKEARPPDRSASFEEFKRWSDAVAKHRKMAEERLDRYLRSGRAGLLNWLINALA